MIATEHEQQQPPAALDSEIMQMIRYWVSLDGTAKGIAQRIIARAKEKGYAPAQVRAAIMAEGKSLHYSQRTIYAMLPPELKDPIKSANRTGKTTTTKKSVAIVATDNSRIITASEPVVKDLHEYQRLVAAASAAVPEPANGTALPPRIHYVKLYKQQYLALWPFIQGKQSCRLRCQDGEVIEVLPLDNNEVRPKW